MNRLNNLLKQRSDYENQIITILNYLKMLNFELIYTDAFISLVSVDDYPSLRAFRNKLHEWGAKITIGSIEQEDITQLTLPIIAVLKSGRYILITNVNNDYIKFHDSSLGFNSTDLKKFINDWTGVIISIETSSLTLKIPNISMRKDNYLPMFNNIKSYDSFLTEEECEAVINEASKSFQKSKVILKGKRIYHKNRTSYTAHLTTRKELEDQIYNRAVDLLDLPRANFESLQCTRYGVGQEFSEHYDSFGKSATDELKKGQRRTTVMIYLNDNFEGGETHFPFLNLKFSPKKGTAIIWDNTINDDLIDPMSFHAGLKIKSGEKFICNLWVRDKPFING